jgi:Uma2 family endonuclease
VALVLEIVSEGSIASGRAIKPRLYAEAGIPRYVRVEFPGPVAVVHTLVDGRYVATPAATELVLPEPFPVRVDLPRLLESHRSSG